MWRTSKSAADSTGNRLPEEPWSARVLVDAVREGNLASVARQLEEQQYPPAVLTRLGYATGYTALGLACNRGHAEVAELLLARRACPDQPICEAGATPLMICVLWDRVAILELLLSHRRRRSARKSCAADRAVPLAGQFA